MTQNDFFINILNTISKKKTEVNYNDVLSTIINRNGNLNYKNITPVKVILSNGMFILSVPRLDNTFSNCYNSNSFFRSRSFNKKLNLSPIIFEESITMNNINYDLIGALCYDVLDNSLYAGFQNSYFYDPNNKIGTYALIKSGEDWIKYNPNMFITLKRENGTINSLLNKYYQEYETQMRNNNRNIVNPDERVDIQTFEVWKNSKEGEEVTNRIKKRKFTYNDIKIESADALSEISTNGCLLFYTEPYNSYRSRCEQTIY